MGTPGHPVLLWRSTTSISRKLGVPGRALQLPPFHWVGSGGDSSQAFSFHYCQVRGSDPVLALRGSQFKSVCFLSFHNQLPQCLPTCDFIYSSRSISKNRKLRLKEIERDLPKCQSWEVSWPQASHCTLLPARRVLPKRFAGGNEGSGHWWVGESGIQPGPCSGGLTQPPSGSGAC